MNSSQQDSMKIVLVSQPETVRHGLRHAVEWLARIGLTEDLRGSAELVLAEVVNNVIEHAYAGDPLGTIEIALDPTDSGFSCTVSDSGAPMPTGTPPVGTLPSLDVAVDDLPEGGYGWFLIRTLVNDLTYDRQGDTNRLGFSMAEQAAVSA